MKHVSLLVSAMVLAGVVLAVTARRRPCYDSRRRYIKWVPGCLNVIITTPHGGHLKPASIPDREAGCYVNGACVFEHGCGVQDPVKCRAKGKEDRFTAEIATNIARNLKRLTGCSPHLVYNQLHRSKLDANREVNEATLNVQEAMDAYYKFSAFIRAAQKEICGPGLLLDLHAQAHPGNRTELGYGIDTLNSGVFSARHSNVRALGCRVCGRNRACFEKLVRGHCPNSLGYYLNAEQYRAVPSPGLPTPGDNPYYADGYNVRTHGSLKGGLVDSILMDIPAEVRSSVGSRRRFAAAVARAVSRYISDHYSGGNWRHPVRPRRRRYHRH